MHPRRFRPALAMLLISTSPALAEDLPEEAPDAVVEVHGYIDGQGILSSVEDESTFVLQDAALQLEAGEGPYMAALDLPMTGGLEENTFMIATGKAQAYVSAEYDSGTYWAFGQFNGPTGLEDNDTVNNPLSRHSYFISSITLSTLTGAKVGHTVGVFDGALMVADPVGGGLMVGNPLFGVSVGLDNESLRAYTAFLSEVRPNGLWYMADFIVGGSVGDAKVDLEVFMTDEPGADRQMGTMLYGAFQMTNKTTAAVLLEGGQDVGMEGLGVGGHAGPQLHLNKTFMVRVDGGVVALEAPDQWELSGSGRFSTVAVF